MRGVAHATAMLVALGAIPTIGRAADDRLPSAEACARIPADTERLGCFDAIFDGKGQSSTAPVAAAAPGAAQEAEFGLTEAQKQGARTQSGQPAEPEEITSRVTRVIPRGMEPPVIELDNGQQWRLLESMANVRFRAGDAIVIRRGSMGSYLISNPDRNGAWRVRRVR